MATAFGLRAFISFHFFVFSFVFFRVSGQCDRYYFGLDGDHCYRCHCTNTWRCDQQRGICTTGPCAQGFGGSSCQYDTLECSSPDPRYDRIVDRFPGTCHPSLGPSHFPMGFDVTNTGSRTDVIILTLKNPMTASGQAASPRNISIIYHESKNVSTRLFPHLAQPDDTLITYHLPRLALVTRVEIQVDANVTLDPCDLSILGGRNLAVGKNATQGPGTYGGTDGKYEADKAVDGNTENDVARCTHTTSGRSWWKVFLGYNLTVWELRIHNRNQAPGSRLKGFVVNATLHNGTEVEVYRHSATTIRLTTNAFLDGPVAATHITVWHDRVEYLTLCEVEVIGDCQDGYYGWECDKRCRCANSSEICDKIWGYCPQTGCRPGFRGDDCTQECQNGTYGMGCAGNCSACVHDSCDHVTGNCTMGCKPGWRGPRCRQECSPGSYGDNCSAKCSSACRDGLCDHVTGICVSCKAGWLGDSCNETCSPGYHGDGCNATCSSGCQGGLCNHVTGFCSSCVPGWQGDMCSQRCSPGSYGDGCHARCPSGCRNGVCDHVTGVCSSCGAGRLGDLCNETCGQGFHGYNCSQSCSNICLQNSCHPATGRCLMGCKQGMTGVVCDDVHATEDKEDDHWLTIGCVIGAVLLLAVAITITGVVIYRRPPRSRRQQKQTDNKDNSHVLMMDELDSPDTAGSDPRNPQKTAVKDDNIHLYALPVKAGDRKRAPEAEMDKPASDVRPAVKASSPAAAPKTASPSAPADSATKPETPTPRPRKAKPELLTLFSRDASLDPPPADPDPDPCPGTRASTEAAARAVSREGLALFSSPAQSPKSQRTTPTPIRKGASFESLDTLSVDDMDLGHQPHPATDRKDYYNVVLAPPPPPPPPPSSSSPSQARRVKGDYYNVVHRDTSPTTTIPLAELTARVAKWLEKPRFFSKQKEMLPAGKMADWKTALIPENLKKSRYRDIFPYDHSRVKLDLLPDDAHSDFYNACYIDGYEKEKEYIAAQGPMERTVYDFLRLIWDVRCSRVVMLTNTVELGRFKCQQYWPAETELTSGDITVRLDSVITFADYCIRLLTLQRGGQCRSVTMYHYTAWPDNFAPASPWSLLDFRQHVRQGACDDAPVIVHCSAGIGRTGTFLALDILLTRAKYCTDVDVFTCVWKLRQQRIHMVQTLAQYIFIHETLSASLLTSPPVSIEEFLKKGQPDVKTEFARLQRCLGPEKLERDDSTPPDVLGPPGDLHRVHIVSVPGGPSPAYINASFMSNYSHHQAYIQTHSPLDEAGAVCFLSMVLQHHVTCIICLDLDQVDTYRIFPELEQRAVRVGPYTVVLDSVSKAPERLVSTLRVGYPVEQGDEPEGENGPTEGWQEVTHIRCTAWPQSRLTPTTSVILDLLEVTKPETVGTSVVYCRNGFSKSGLFCTAAAVIERMRAEGQVAVNHVTAHMRVPRRENIVNEDQYRFLYECVRHRITQELGAGHLQELGAGHLQELGAGHLQELGAGHLQELSAGHLQDPPVTDENLYSNIGDLPGAGAGDAATPPADGNAYVAMQIRASAGRFMEASGSDGARASAGSTGYIDMNCLSMDSPRRLVQASATADENIYGNTPTTSAASRRPEKDAAGQAGQPTREENIYGNMTGASNTAKSAQRVAGKGTSGHAHDASTDENLYGNTVDISAERKSAGKGSNKGATARVEDPSTDENIYGNAMAISATTRSGKDTNGTGSDDPSAGENLYGNVSSY